MNLIDQPRAANLWTEVDRNLYNQLPIYFAQRQVEYIKQWDVWGKMLRPQKWSPNMGNTMRGINKVPSPILRGQFLPQPITSLPRKDVIEPRETSEDTQLYRHDFESNVFQFLPSFQDFLTNHIDFNSDDISEKLVIAKDYFYRTAIFHASPFVYVCGPTDAPTTELRTAPRWTAPTIALSKTAAYLQALTAVCSGALTLENIKKLGTVLGTDLQVVPFSGRQLADGTDGTALKQKYCLITCSEVWDAFTDTGSYLLNNKALDLDIVTDGFTGSLFGRWTTKFERYEMRIAADGTIPAPETVEENPDAYDEGDTVPNPLYVNAPWGVAFAVGNEAYKAVQVGPPPAKFSGSYSMSMKDFNGMDWSGKVGLTRNVLVPSLDAAGVTVMDTNKRGEHCQLIAEGIMGIAPIRRRNIVPVIYRRSRIATT